MDLNTVTAVTRPRSRSELDSFVEGDAWLAGGTWLFSEPQPDVRRLIDLSDLGWEPIEVTQAGLSIASTCTIATLEGFDPPKAWRAGSLIGQCCHAFLASFKIWNMATIGGNLCCALPAGPMISLCVALDGTCVIWGPNRAERRLAVLDFVIAPQQHALGRGELLRAIELPRAAFDRRAAFRQISLTPLGRSAALLIGTLGADGAFDLTVTAATRRPIQLDFGALPDPRSLQQRLQADIPLSLYYDDVHGAPDWRRHMTFEFAEEIRSELACF
ncbi:FAD binding domain-containing protein [Lichenifustis flavocetrariae]|uniref:FAD binding domain-containing protein n=1 Tax=Lichenifustis flavocetrariae TaxID=2949735 RepID=A0AA41Z5E7_9HYPH|nr:FAD binding domain-containing protein [Lichenifustis flavocetrariae]MCW6510808.1 FAD binding domain-containing protein [Lichenifustis flavocetrariae]